MHAPSYFRHNSTRECSKRSRIWLSRSKAQSCCAGTSSGKPSSCIGRLTRTLAQILTAWLPTNWKKPGRLPPAEVRTINHMHEVSSNSRGMRPVRPRRPERSRPARSPTCMLLPRRSAVGPLPPVEAWGCLRGGSARSVVIRRGIGARSSSRGSFRFGERGRGGRRNRGRWRRGR